jgi:hypothetical protein
MDQWNMLTTITTKCHNSRLKSKDGNPLSKCKLRSGELTPTIMVRSLSQSTCGRESQCCTHHRKISMRSVEHNGQMLRQYHSDSHLNN